MRAARGRLRVDERGLRAGLVSVDDRHRGFAEACAACSLRRRCRGVFAGYLARRGAAGWPVSREVPNSFNWEPQGRRAAVAAPVPRGPVAARRPIRGSSCAPVRGRCAGTRRPRGSRTRRSVRRRRRTAGLLRPGRAPVVTASARAAAPATRRRVPPAPRRLCGRVRAGSNPAFRKAGRWSRKSSARSRERCWTSAADWRRTARLGSPSERGGCATRARPARATGPRAPASN